MKYSSAQAALAELKQQLENASVKQATLEKSGNADRQSVGELRAAAEASAAELATLTGDVKKAEAEAARTAEALVASQADAVVLKKQKQALEVQLAEQAAAVG